MYETSCINTLNVSYTTAVSWEGFNAAVEKEARQSFFKIRLWDADDILEAIQRNYDRFSEELQKELPLKRMWVLVAGEE